MQLVTGVRSKRHVSQDTVEELETAILADPRVSIAEMSSLATVAVAATCRAAARLGINAGRILGAARQDSNSRADYFAVMMGLDASAVAPWFIRNARKSVYLFDAWPSHHEAIVDFVESWGVQYAFVSSSEATERLKGLSDRCTFIWVPEGIDPTRYQHRSYIERDIDVLQLGRRYDSHHALIAPVLEKAGKIYVYERTKGELVYPDREDFVAGLSRARISVCTPSSLTHPERAGDIETMTIRYLQSMVSRCLVLGHAPREMIDLFEYNPVVEIDMENAGAQVLGLLDRFEDYVPLIERNFEAVTRSHTWTNRWERMSEVLFA